MTQGTSEPQSHAELIDDLQAELATARPEPVAEFARRLLARGSADFLAELSAEEVADALTRLYRLLERAGPDEVAIELTRDPDDPARAVLQTVMEDRPFIVDTIREYVHSFDLDIRHLMHPVLVLERDEEGRLSALHERTAEGTRMSIVHMSLAGALGDGALERLEEGLARRLEQLQAVTDDFEPMRRRVAEIREELEEQKEEIPWRAAEFEEIRELLEWMDETGFVFLGYRNYDLEADEEGQHWIRVVPGSGLGILRDEKASRYGEAKLVEDLPKEVRARALAGPVLIVSKTNAESPIRRRAQMDYVGIKRLAADGTVQGEHRFLGLYTAKAFNQDASDIPILRRKLREILQQEGAPKGSHDYNVILRTFNSMPKEELFASTVEEIRGVVETVMQTEGADDVRVTSRPDSLGRGYNVMVILPKNRFSAAVRRKLQAALTETYHGRLLNYHLALGQGDQARLHFYVSHDPAEPLPNPSELEAIVRETVRSWDERLSAALAERFDPPEAQRLAKRFTAAFPTDYQAAVRIETAVGDVEHLERLASTGSQQASLRPRADDRAGDGPAAWEMKVFAQTGELVLSDVIPTLENLGFRVLDSVRYRVPAGGGPRLTIHVFQVTLAADAVDAAAEGRVADALRAVSEHRTEDDRLNSLVLTAGLTWEEVGVLRAYAGYAFRIGAVASRQGGQRPLITHVETARLLFESFAVRFDPDREGDREAAWRTVHGRFVDSLAEVHGIEDDRTLRRLHALVLATQRTNYFRGELRASPVISLKLDCRAVDFMPDPRPRHEVYMRGPRTEAAHLRMDDVARGGIRWSDRYEDFRVEVLGLVKTQRVKNAVIVPAGAKGAFITTDPPEEPEARRAAGLESYREFIRGLLEIADNVVDGEVRHPERVVIHDGPDSYLVVAADKGTAKNSDTANELAAEAAFWLGDAFASGGSNGYDHKAEGITARGAWECVTRHFRELDLDYENEPFTVAGIGDMSGDVFGNGMLLSRNIELLAAFDHRHVFLDPDPDPEASWRERKRLFDLPTSSWADYDESLISEGGGVFPRTEKQIALSERVRERLDIREETVNAEELIRAILRMPVDLLWNGGIGTYLKATPETHASVGDPSNDGVRVDAADVRARVIGEGGNLGLTQRARIEYARDGGRVNTDALDNSAGVDMSDHEVNLKILLGGPAARGDLTEKARNRLLRACTDEVAEAVLSNNRTQSLAISLDERRVEENPGAFAAAIRRLEREGVLDPGLEDLPTADELEDRAGSGPILTRPELAILLAHSKLHLKGLLLASGIPHDPAMMRLVEGYFPPTAVEAIEPDDLAAHRLRPNIASTVLANQFVDRMGAACHIRLMGEADRAGVSVVRAWYVAGMVSDADALYARLGAGAADIPIGARYNAYLEISNALGRATNWLLARTSPTEPIARAIEWLQGPVREIRASLADLLGGERLEALESRRALYEMDGFDPQTASDLSTFQHFDELLPMGSLVRRSGADPRVVAGAYLGLVEEVDFPWLRARLDELAEDDPWSERGARILAERLEDARLAMAALVLEQAEQTTLERAFERFRHDHAVDLSRIRGVIAEIRSADEPSLASLLVAVDAVADPRLATAGP